MKEYLRTILEEGGTLATEDIILHIVAAAILSFAIYISYWYTHSGTSYSKNLTFH